ncbi:hypothetical protein BMS3Bbin04_01187 [bacterium BMS3Bbin04]|nr:hypothetical protein BMS3Bbin04_01187 [bacterium BMS3Bbin04]
MRPQRESDPVTVAIQLLVFPLDPVELALSCAGIVGEINHHTGERSPNTHLFHSFSDSVEIPVHVIEKDSPTADHLHNGQLRAPIDLVTGNRTFVWPDPLGQPFH